MKTLLKRIAPLVLTMIFAAVAAADCPLITCDPPAFPGMQRYCCIKNGQYGNLCTYGCSFV